jgi:glycosyltransferase involved in cell wall biosynthesis
MDISFIVPCYNAEKTLVKCIDSILSQDIDATFEVIVVDNNSTDSSAIIAEKFKERICFVKEEKQGRSYARNYGAMQARGELLAFIDADVYLDKDWAKTLKKSFDENKEVGAGQGQIIPCREEGVKSLNQYRYRCVDEETKGRFILTEIKRFEFPMINTAACMYRKSVFKEIGGFDVYLERHEDIDLSRRVFLFGQDISCSTSATAHVIFHGESWVDYFKRSFDDGHYKGAFLQKWSGMPLTIKELPPNKKIDFVKWFFSQSSKAVTHFSFHDLLVLLLNMTNAYGRFYGRLNYIYPINKPVMKFSPNGVGQVYIDQKALCE